MKKHVFSNVDELQPSLLNAFFDDVATRPHVISLSVGEPDFPTPWHIASKGIQAIQDGKTFYSASNGLLDLRKAISKHVLKEYEAKYNPSEVLITNGASEAIDLSLRCLINPGDEVVLLDPGYVSYEPLVILCRGVPVRLKLDFNSDFSIDISKLEKLVNEKTKAIILNFPNNPTGGVISEKSVQEIASFCLKKDIILISDEIYSELTYSKENCSFLKAKDFKKNLIYINGLSKSYSMTGWRIGYVLSNKKIIEKMNIIHQFSTMCPSIISQYAGIEALENGDDDIKEMRHEYFKRRDYVVDRLKSMNLELVVPQGAFYAFPKIPDVGMNSLDFCKSLLEEEGLAVIPGTAFGENGEGFIRISYAYSMADLKMGLDRLEDFIKKHK